MLIKTETLCNSHNAGYRLRKKINNLFEQIISQKSFVIRATIINE